MEPTAEKQQDNKIVEDPEEKKKKFEDLLSQQGRIHYEEERFLT